MAFFNLMNNIRMPKEEHKEEKTKEYGTKEVIDDVRKFQEIDHDIVPMEKVQAISGGSNIKFETFWNSKTGQVGIRREGMHSITYNGEKTARRADEVYGIALETIRDHYGESIEFKFKETNA